MFQQDNNANENDLVLDLTSHVQRDQSLRATGINDNVPTVPSLPKDDNDKNHESLFDGVSEIVGEQTRSKEQEQETQTRQASDEAPITSFTLNNLRRDYPPPNDVISAPLDVAAIADDIGCSRLNERPPEVVNFCEQSTSTVGRWLDCESSCDQSCDLTPPALPASLPPSSLRPQTLPLDSEFDSGDIASPLSFVLPPPSPYATSPTEPTTVSFTADDTNTVSSSLNSIHDLSQLEAAFSSISVQQIHSELAQEEPPWPTQSPAVLTTEEQQVVCNTNVPGMTDDECAVTSQEILEHSSVAKDQKPSGEIASYLSLIGGCGYSNRRQMATAVRAMIAKSSTSPSEQSGNDNEAKDGSQPREERDVDLVQSSTSDAQKSVLTEDNGFNKLKVDNQHSVNNSPTANDQSALTCAFYEKEGSNKRLEATTGEDIKYDAKPDLSDTSKPSAVGPLKDMASAAFVGKEATCERGGVKQGDTIR